MPVRSRAAPPVSDAGAAADAGPRRRPDPLLLWARLGAAGWIVLVALRPPAPPSLDWPQAVLAGAALVLVPLLLRLARDGAPAGGAGEGTLRIVALAGLPAAVLLALSTMPDRGASAAALAAPWLAVTGGVALAGLLRLVARWRSRTLSLADATVDAGLAMLAVGGGWTVLARLGARPLGFVDAIVLLTGVHFHFAGLALPVLTGLAARRLGGPAATAACLGVLAGVPGVAVGITASQLGLGPAAETAAVAVAAAGALLAAGLHLRLALAGGERPAARLLWAVAGLSLLGATGLALLYGLRAHLAVPGLTIPRMWATHGSLNAFGFVLCGTVGWTLAGRARDGGPGG